MAPRSTDLNRIAYSQDGFFTSGQARACGFSAQLLAHHVDKGRYERVRRGLYRLAAYPGSSHEEVRAKWLTLGAERAVVSHESALELHGLSDVLPSAVHLLVSRRDRGIRPPAGVVLHTTTAPLDRRDVVVREGIRTTSPARSIVDAASSGTAPEQILMAVQQAIEEGMVTRRSLLEHAARRSARVTSRLHRALHEVGVT